MKFAFQLSEDLVPEWRDQYLDYKLLGDIGRQETFKKIGKNASKPSLLENPRVVSSLLAFSAGARERALSIVRPSPAWVPEPSPGIGAVSVNIGLDSVNDPRTTLEGFSLPPSATSNEAPVGPLNTTQFRNDLNEITESLDPFNPSSYGSTEDAKLGLYDNTLPISHLSKGSALDTSITEQSPLLDSSSVPKRYKPRPNQQPNVEETLGSSLKKNLHIKSIANKFTDGIPGSGSLRIRKKGENTSPEFDAMYTADEQEFMDWLDSEFNKIQKFYRQKEDDSIERYLILQDQLFNLREQKFMQKAHLAKRAAAVAAVKEAHKRNQTGVSKTTAETAIAETKKIATDISYKVNRKFDLPSLPTPFHDYLFKRTKNLEDHDVETYLNQYPDQNEPLLTDSAPTDVESPSESASIKSAAIGASTGAQASSSSTPYPRHHTFTNRMGNPVLTATVNKSDIAKGNEPGPISRVHNKDYMKRPREDRISYGVARRQLKMAVVELYRELGMLKSYRSLNQTAFRKMIKKFDKVTGHHALNAYLTKVNQSYLAQSDVLDDLIRKTEDMFALYFEGGNHKHAVEKLRNNTVHEDHYFEMFNTGFFLGLAIPIAAFATYRGVNKMNDGDPDALFLFQIWGGFFLIILFMCLFAINCLVWTKYKVNYPFIFEFNPLSHLNAHQVGSVPAFMFFLLSLLAWMGFEDFWPEKLPQIYYPVVYLGILLGVLFWPYKGFHQEARKWLQVALWRVFFSGLYPVEFRDLIMGDISCSLTYSVSNCAFFFCLYATHWSGLLPGNTSGSHCGSSHSRWMGLLSALPGIWRFLQCGRRFLDSGDAFPHVANMGKYAVQIGYNAFLSAYRIDLGSTTFRSFFLTFAAMNSIYSGFWDLFMDWSVMQFTSKNFLLRDELAFKSKTPYYIAMVLDLILRCNWVFYAIYANEIEQSAKVSFFVALSELLRRFMWVFFRVENEHCSNVLRFRASKDVTLPYQVVKRKQGVRSETESVIGEATTPVAGPMDEEAQIGQPIQHVASNVSVTSVNKDETAVPTAVPSPRIKPEPRTRNVSFGARLHRFVEPALRAVGTTLQSAHVRDFERRKDKPKDPSDHGSIDSDDEDEDDEEEFYDNMSQLGGHPGSHTSETAQEAENSPGGHSSHPPSHSYLESPDTRIWRDQYL